MQAARQLGFHAEPPLHVDLRTPRSTYDSFLRAVLRRQPEALWRAVHPDLGFYLRKLYVGVGDCVFFDRLATEVAFEGRTARLGSPEIAGRGVLTCPLMQDGFSVGVAGFQVHEGGWVLSLLA